MTISFFNVPFQLQGFFFWKGDLLARLVKNVTNPLQSLFYRAFTIRLYLYMYKHIFILGFNSKLQLFRSVSGQEAIRRIVSVL
jgi:hypothetical protein